MNASKDNWWWPLVAGALTGVALRFLFSDTFPEPYTTMMVSFVLLAPLVVGAVTVYLAERQRRRDWAYYIWAPFLANILFVIATFVIAIEGIICAIVALPLFGILGVVGGLLMGAVCRLTKWPTHTLSGVVLLPLLLGYGESGMPLPQASMELERSTYVDAPPSAVWTYLMNTGAIEPEDVRHGWIYRIGVPLPLNGSTTRTGEGLRRDITMGKGIRFAQLSTDWRENRYVHWKYRFEADSIPSRALDDHVRIGGPYFDLTETSYLLDDQQGGTTLTIRMRYRVSTGFNWYAVPVSELLISNFEEVILDFYRKRSERRPG